MEMPPGLDSESFFEEDLAIFDSSSSEWNSNIFYICIAMALCFIFFFVSQAIKRQNEKKQ